MTEKDQYGDTLRNREQAEEDRYMAEQDRLRLEKLRAKSKAASLTVATCPACASLVARSAGEPRVFGPCPRCGGVWMTADVVRELATRGGEVASFFRKLVG
jgi:hypothetical protein